MQPYQTFYPQMNNNYQMPMQNPYMDRMNFLQNYQQNLQQPMIPAQMSGTNQQMSVTGKVVDSIDVVNLIIFRPNFFNKFKVYHFLYSPFFIVSVL